MKSMTLREARDWRGWTQVELEELSGIAQTHISKLEKGIVKDPSNATVAALENALKVPRGTLVFGQVMEQAS